jgi:hypothetical protein
MRAMPSPTGRNTAALYLPKGFPQAAGGAYDAAPPRSMLAKACAWMAANGCSAADVAEFVTHMHGGGEVEGEDETASERVHNAMEAAASSDTQEATQLGEIGKPRFGKDVLPTYKPNGMPKHALDESLRNMRKIGRGPLGYA